MKIQKGDAGYLRRRKRLLILEAVVSFGLVAALIIAGYVTTKTKLNLLTVVAVLGCLPASRILVNLIMVMPHDSIDEATELEISAVTEELTVAYDLVITSEKKAMPVAAVAIYNNTICGYVPVKKVVKLFHDYKAFLTRAEGMNNIASVEQQDTRKHEEMIKGLLLDISL